jgi:N-acetylglucosaminyldiphosphoundecaprenol N-acetyl-beta-D-mannosaminyltransferase
MAAIVTAPARTRVLGVNVDLCDVFARAVALHGHGGGQIVTLNAEMTMAARADPALGAAIESADLVIPDGAGVVWALGRQGYRVKRSPGIELARRLLRHAAAAGWRVGLVGASPMVMERLLPRLVEELPGLRVVFSEHGYQSADAWPELERRLLALRPDLVLVALGVPRQETWIQNLPRPLPGLWMGVGGSFDVWAGVKKRAPAWMSTLQIEWLYRLIKEPTRWRRMLALPAFAWAVLRQGR